MTRKDYEEFDYLIGMEQWNIRNINRIIRKDPEHKVHLLLEYAGDARDIADPWYTGNFDETYLDIMEGCKGFLKYLKDNRENCLSFYAVLYPAPWLPSISG